MDLSDLIVWSLAHPTPIEVALFILGAACVTIALGLVLMALFRD